MTQARSQLSQLTNEQLMADRAATLAAAQEARNRGQEAHLRGYNSALAELDAIAQQRGLVERPQSTRNNRSPYRGSSRG